MKSFESLLIIFRIKSKPYLKDLHSSKEYSFALTFSLGMIFLVTWYCREINLFSAIKLALLVWLLKYLINKNSKNKRSYQNNVLNYCKNKVFKMITCLFNFRTSFKYTVGVSPLLTRYYVGAYPRNLYLTSRSLKSWPKDFISFKLVTPRTTTTLLLVVNLKT